MTRGLHDRYEHTHLAFQSTFIITCGFGDTADFLPREDEPFRAVTYIRRRHDRDAHALNSIIFAAHAPQNRPSGFVTSLSVNLLATRATWNCTSHHSTISIILLSNVRLLSFGDFRSARGRTLPPGNILKPAVLF